MCFLYIFQSLISLEKWRCDVPCGTTQSYFHPMTLWNFVRALLNQMAITTIGTNNFFHEDIFSEMLFWYCQPPSMITNHS
jgi:hypothetical protein